MDEAGHASAATAVAILGVTTTVKLAQIGSTGLVERLAQRWRRR